MPDADHITPKHYDEKLAELGMAFEAMKEHPLCRKFLRNNIELYVNTTFDSPLFSPVPRPPLAWARKVIDIPNWMVKELSVDELKGFVGHELAHFLRLDNHAKRGLVGHVRLNKDSETLADQIAVVLTGNAVAMASAVEKVWEHYKKHTHDHMAIKLGGENPGVKAIDWVNKRIIATGSLAYPGAARRLEIIRDAGERIAEEESRKAFVKEIADKLLQQHKKLFPKQFTRAIANERTQLDDIGR